MGAQTRRQAAQSALDRFANRGVTGFVDRAGRRWELESYTEMALRTANGRAQVAGTLDRLQAGGIGLVIVSNHPQECPLCRPWEGKVLSITGTVPAGVVLDDGAVVAGSVAQAQVDGLQHANCRHTLTAYVPGLTVAPGHTADPAGDRARQEQRRLERGVRQWRRREAVALDEPARRSGVRPWPGTWTGTTCSAAANVSGSGPGSQNSGFAGPSPITNVSALVWLGSVQMSRWRMSSVVRPRPSHCSHSCTVIVSAMTPDGTPGERAPPRLHDVADDARPRRFPCPDHARWPSLVGVAGRHRAARRRRRRRDGR
jgi:hypothetical protein